jgi:ATP-dependent Clp protease ATP-binding subunit ClpX
VKLHFTESARKSIAKKAMSKNTGARGLRAIIENVLADAMYEVCFFYYHEMNNLFIV